MNKTNLMQKTACLLMGALSLAACQKEYFDPNKYNQLVEVSFPVDHVDEGHTWATVHEVSLKVYLTDEAAYDVYVLTGDPVTDVSAKRIHHVRLSGNSVQQFKVCCPLNATQLWVTTIDSQGQMVRSSTTINGAIDQATVSMAEGKATELTLAQLLKYLSKQDYTFCFEENFPTTGDWDFNDMVMAADIDRGYGNGTTEPDTLIVTTTLRAVGSTGAIAAAMRLRGVTLSDVEPHYVARNAFPYYKYGGAFLKEDPNCKLLEKTAESKAEYRDVAIPLFNDAHYAISGREDNTGAVVRCYYNTRTAADLAAEPSGVTSGLTVEPITAEYRVLFKPEQREKLNSFNMTDLDLFIITSYNGAFFETHTVPYKTAEVVYQYMTADNYEAYSKNYPWALLVAANFQYPKEGTAIGSFQENVYGGAYQIPGHCFADWAQHRGTARDWFLYPDETGIYK